MLNITKLQNHFSRNAQRTALQVVALFGALLATSMAATAADQSVDYRMLATSKTATMEKELNQAAAEGFRFSKVMGGKATSGGKVIIAMVKQTAAPKLETPKYRLLATSRTSTMQAEMQELANAGYSYLDHTVFDSALGGKEVAVIMELDPQKSAPANSLYRLLATTRASTMENELHDASAQGYALLGFTAGKLGAGGSEIIAILRKDN